MHCERCGAQAKPTDSACRVCGGALATSDSLPDYILIVQEAGHADRTVPIYKDHVTIGRDDDCDVVIEGAGISRRHATLERCDGVFTVRDQHSLNGIFVRGARVEEAVLRPDEPLRIPDPYGNVVSITLHAKDNTQARSRETTPHILAPLDLLQLSIGRGSDNDLVLDQPLISRHHARLERRQGLLLIHDLKSTNGTYINGRRVHKVRPLRQDDILQIGLSRFAVQSDRLEALERQPRIRIDVIDLVREAGGKPILGGVSLSLLPQEFVALIGGSGAGKSTLLKALNGAAPAHGGSVFYNGQDFYRNPGPYASMIGYVPQDDILHKELTVTRALSYAARLRLPGDTRSEERAERIDRVLTNVGMTEHRHKAINVLSGGQRKRVNIALELLPDPSVLFLDEPTSGLDPGLDKTVMSLLQELGDAGRTIVLVTHTTGNIGMCNLVAIMAKAQLVYFGPPAEAPAFFGVPTFADIYTRCEVAEIKELQQRFRASSYFKSYVGDRQAPAPTPPTNAPPAPLKQRQVRGSALRQWAILTQRYGELVWRDRVNLAVLVAQAPIIGILLVVVASTASFTRGEVIYSQEVLLMLMLSAIWFGSINAAREIVKELPIYRRERMVNLRLWPYILSKFSVLSVLSLVQSLALLFIVWLRLPHIVDKSILLPPFIELDLSLLLTSLAGLALGLLISSRVASADRAMSVVPIVLLALAIFCGGIFDLSGVTEDLSYVFISHWCLAALGSTVDLNGLAGPLAIPGWPKTMYSAPNAAHLLGYWGVLLLLTAVFLTGAYGSLRQADNRSL